MARKTFKEIQDEVIKKYRIKLNPNSSCWRRTHAHIKTRTVCKWKQKNSVASTFILFHEIGHIVTNNSSMRRCEEEYHATVWAIKQAKAYGIEIPKTILEEYQEYIYDELDRGLRRGGKNYPTRKDLCIMDIGVEGCEDVEVQDYLNLIGMPELTESYNTFPEEEREGKSDFGILRDEIEYFLDLYTDGSIYSEELKRCKKILDETENGKYVPIDGDILGGKFKFRYTEDDIKRARQVVQQYTNLRIVHRKLKGV